MQEERTIRIAAVGDLHFDGSGQGSLRRLFSEISDEAQILALCGDLTTHGEPDQIAGLLQELAAVDIPTVAVLGNHDFETGQEERLTDQLRSAGVHVLDGSNVVIEGVGFAGTKGFGGGFGRRTLGAFGERIYKEFVQTALDEALKLETALRTLRTEVRVVLLHYSPVRETLEGESEEIFPFLGSSRLLAPIETYDASVVFHGHAHIGVPEAISPAGIPIFNVARTVLERATGQSFRVWSARAPERRQREKS